MSFSGRDWKLKLRLNGRRLPKSLEVRCLQLCYQFTAFPVRSRGFFLRLALDRLNLNDWWSLMLAVAEFSARHSHQLCLSVLLYTARSLHTKIEPSDRQQKQNELLSHIVCTIAVNKTFRPKNEKYMSCEKNTAEQPADKHRESVYNSQFKYEVYILY